MSWLPNGEEDIKDIVIVKFPSQRIGFVVVMIFLDGFNLINLIYSYKYSKTHLLKSYIQAHDLCSPQGTDQWKFSVHQEFHDLQILNNVVELVCVLHFSNFLPEVRALQAFL